MERVPFFETLIGNERARQKAINAAADDSQLDPLDSPKRTDVCPGTYLKENDDVACYSGSMVVRVLAAVQGRDNFAAWWIDSELGTPQVGTVQVEYVTDRAPADPNEEAMPNGSIYIPTP